MSADDGGDPAPQDGRAGGGVAAPAAEHGAPEETPAPAPRRRSRRPGWRAVLVALLTAGVVGSAAWVVLFSPVLGVREITVVGNLTVPAAQIRQAAAVPRDHPLATVDLAAVRTRVLGIRQVGAATVERVWPGTLRVAVAEREPVVVVPVAGRSALMDEFGVVTEVKSVAPARLPVLRVARPGPSDPVTLAALKVVVSLPAELAAQVTEVRAATEESVTLELRDRRVVVWGGSDRPKAKARVLTTLLEQPAKTYDVSSPEVVTVE